MTSKSYYYVFGMCITGCFMIMFLIKSLCSAPFASNQGEIMGHIFALKTIPLILFPVYG